jgi:major membrane immunogen (membrane-anchored lipoprotein)
VVRAVFFVLAVSILASGCGSSDKPASTASDASSEEILKKNCADPKWKEQNLGLWYSVCRQPLRW